MKLQKATELALYAILEFAANPSAQVSAAEIAEKYGVSPHHLAKVLRELGRAGLVESTRGVGGGYRFAGNAKRLTLLDVIELFETLGPDPAALAAGTPGERALARVASEIDEIAKATFRSITIDTMLKLVERERRQAAPAPAPAAG
ncbi:MAG: Rrf2 family transcriptional regulator [Burkholderiales bacterium]|nr:Rrf2 family transcriptional regulator [Burkholderiales bacterium]